MIDPSQSPLRFIGLGFELVVPVLAGVFLGLWVDRRFDSAPWGVVAGAVLGISAGFLNFFRAVLPRNGGGGPSR